MLGLEALKTWTRKRAHVAEARLPRGGDLPVTVGEHFTIFAVELRKGVFRGPSALWRLGPCRTDNKNATGSGVEKHTEIVDQAHVVALHDDARRDEHTPHDGLGVEADALQQGHALLLVRGRLCIVDELVLGLETRQVVVAMVVVGGRRRCRCRRGDVAGVCGRHGSSPARLTRS